MYTDVLSTDVICKRTICDVICATHYLTLIYDTITALYEAHRLRRYVHGPYVGVATVLTFAVAASYAVGAA